MIIWSINREAHMKAFAKTMDIGNEHFFKFMADQFIKTHEIYLNKIAKAYNLDSIFDSLLEPSAQDK